MEKNLVFDPSKITRLAVRTAWPNIEIHYDDVSEFRVIIAGDDKSVAQMRVEVENNDLIIEQPQYGVFKNYTEGSWMQIFVYVPKGLDIELSVNTITGSSQIKACDSKKAFIEAISGKILASNFISENIQLQTVSGSIKLKSAISNILKCKTVSGKLLLEDINAKNVSLTSVSGQQSIEFSNVFEGLNATLISGNLEVTQPSEFIKANLKAVSGKLIYDNVKESQSGPEINATTVSGSIKIKRN